ncbi:MAG: hypothetical protein BWZ02_01863 [Lentisphaerae bacterium ADurb.BinA184]|nr:MAG: hypothetical protein BWZ02_01863 [Lentisphaerae bacterium ADurb.BinA184]
MQKENLDSLGDERERRRPRLAKKRPRSEGDGDAESRRAPRLPLKGRHERTSYLDEMDPDEEDGYPLPR